MGNVWRCCKQTPVKCSGAGPGHYSFANRRPSAVSLSGENLFTWNVLEVFVYSCLYETSSESGILLKRNPLHIFFFCVYSPHVLHLMFRGRCLQSSCIFMTKCFVIHQSYCYWSQFHHSPKRWPRGKFTERLRNGYLNGWLSWLKHV